MYIATCKIRSYAAKDFFYKKLIILYSCACTYIAITSYKLGIITRAHVKYFSTEKILRYSSKTNLLQAMSALELYVAIYMLSISITGLQLFLYTCHDYLQY